MSIDDNFIDPMDDVLADNLVEVLATMTKDQREKFVKTLNFHLLLGLMVDAIIIHFMDGMFVIIDFVKIIFLMEFTWMKYLMIKKVY